MIRFKINIIAQYACNYKRLTNRLRGILVSLRFTKAPQLNVMALSQSKCSTFCSNLSKIKIDIYNGPHYNHDP